LKGITCSQFIYSRDFLYPLTSAPAYVCSLLASFTDCHRLRPCLFLPFVGVFFFYMVSTHCAPALLPKPYSNATESSDFLEVPPTRPPSERYPSPRAKPGPDRGGSGSVTIRVARDWKSTERLCLMYFYLFYRRLTERHFHDPPAPPSRSADGDSSLAADLFSKFVNVSFVPYRL